MTDAQKELFTKYADCVREHQTMAENLLFQNSFRLGARIMLEVMLSRHYPNFFAEQFPKNFPKNEIPKNLCVTGQTHFRSFWWLKKGKGYEYKTSIS